MTMENSTSPSEEEQATTGWKHVYVDRILPGITATKPQDRIELFDRWITPTIQREGVLLVFLPRLLAAFAQTCARYTDRESRQAVLRCWEQLFRTACKKDPVEAPAIFLAFFQQQSNALVQQKSDELGYPNFALVPGATESWKLCDREYASAAFPRYVLLTWTVRFATFLLQQKDSENTAVWNPSLEIIAGLYDSCLGKQAIRHNLHTQAKRIVKHQFLTQRPLSLESFAISMKEWKNAPLEHVAFVGALLEAFPKQVTPEIKESVLEMLVKSILSAKIRVAPHRISSLGSFLASVTLEEVESLIVSQVTKLLLRSPEVSLNTLALLVAHCTAVDFSESFSTVFADPVIVQFKSANEQIRKDAMELWKQLVSRSQDATYLVDVVKRALKPIASKTASPEQKLSIYRALGHLARTNLTPVLEAVAKQFLPILEKETSETALQTGLDVIGPMVVTAQSLATFASFIEKGVRAQKEPIRIVYLQCLAAVVKEVDGISLENTGALLKGIAGLSSSASPLESILASFILLRSQRSGDMSAGTVTRLLQNNSTILSEKAVVKLADPQAALDLAAELAIYHSSSTAFTVESWKSLLRTLFWTVRQPSSFNVRRQATEIFAKLISSDEQRPETVVSPPLISIIDDFLTNTPASAFDQKLDKNSIGFLLKHLATFSKEYIESHLTEVEQRLFQLLPLVNHPYVCTTDNVYAWPDLVNSIRVVSQTVDAEDLIRRNCTTTLDILLAHYGSKTVEWDQAILASIAVLVFVCPEATLPVVNQKLKEMLNAQNDKQDLSFQDVAIWKTDPSETYVDVLKKENNSGSRDRTEKWEQELRAELEAKRAVSKQLKPVKLSRDQQILVNQQLEKESQIRARVEAIYRKQILGVSLIDKLLSIPREDCLCDIRFWIQLLQGVLHFADRIGGKLAVEQGWTVPTLCYGTISKIARTVSDDIRPVSEAALIALLRNQELQTVPERWQEEELDTQIRRVMEFLSNHVLSGERFTPVSFAVLFPLLEHLVMEAVKEDVKAKPIVDSIVDILTAHSRLGLEKAFPRHAYIALLIAVIGQFPKHVRVAQADLQELSADIGENATDQEVHLLLNGILSRSAAVRFACLQALEYVEITEANAADFATRVWIACHDKEEANQTFGKDLWENSEMEIGPEFRQFLVPLSMHPVEDIRWSAGRAIAHALEIHPQALKDTLSTIYSTYDEMVKPPPPVFDKYGVAIAPEMLDRWEARSGLLWAIEASAESIVPNEHERFLDFLISDPACLGDSNEIVQRQALNAGVAVIDQHGKANLTFLLNKLERFLDSAPQDTDLHDQIREAVVILLGAAAKHMDHKDPRVKKIVRKLMEALRTPSEPVQHAVADCLPPLIRLMRDDGPVVIAEALKLAVEGESFAIRRGGAFGLAGALKGRGIWAIKECRIMEKLEAAIDDKKKYECRQGALFAFEIMSRFLGQLFEPYVLRILPFLLACFGDNVAPVREAAAETARVIMANLTAHCTKMILPTVLRGLEEYKWRSKAASVELLGYMAYCAPKQLAISLPTIIPRLSEVLNDSHPQVQAGAKAALLKFSDILQNPEIKKLSPILMKALADPTNHVLTGLSALMSTSFAHYIDAPSLALVIPIVERGLKERSTDVKKKAAQIIGNMASLTEPKDLLPYMATMIPLTREVMVDPVPEARAIAAKALGSIVERLGEDNFPLLVDQLLSTLKANGSGVDRQGSAQGLAEVLAGIGVVRLEQLLPDIIDNVSSTKPYEREGFMLLLIYLPATFGEKFVPFLPSTIPSILRGLADEFEYVRDASMKAGQVVVNRFSANAVEVLLPELERGLFNESWRIRASSTQLLGELLFKISGTSMNDEHEGDSNDDVDLEPTAMETNRRVLIELLGLERYHGMLAALYVLRNDLNVTVRQTSMQVWKSIVVNTPRMLKEILPTLIMVVVKNLASDSDEKRQLAAATLGDLVHKLGEFMMAEIVPILREQLESPDERTRQGVCVGISQILSSTASQHIEAHAEELVEVVKAGLMDTSPDVRSAAAQAFDILHQQMGAAAIDEIIPPLLAGLSDNKDSIEALDALKEIMAVRGNVVFPMLLPTFTARPISEFNARALASLILVAGSVINKRLSDILLPLMEELSLDLDGKTEIQHAISTLMESIDNAEGLHSLMMTLFESMNADEGSSDKRRRVTLFVLESFCVTNTRVSMSRFLGDWITTLVSLMDESVCGSRDLVISAWRSFDALIKRTKKEEYDSIASVLRRAIQSLVSEVSVRKGMAEAQVDAFNIPKGISPFLSVLLHCLMYGNSDVREQASLAIGDLIQSTEPEKLKPSVMQITGPLIRIVGEKFSWQIKAANLENLRHLLNKVPLVLRPFLPQLQRTFVKALSDTNLNVRRHAAAALGILIKQLPQIEPLIKELEKSIREESADETKEGMLIALWQILCNSAQKLTPTTVEAVLKTTTDLFVAETESLRRAASICQATLVANYMAVDTVAAHVQKSYLREDAPPNVWHASMVVLDSLMATKPELLAEKEVIKFVNVAAADHSALISELGVQCLGRMLYRGDTQVLSTLVATIKEKPSDLKRIALLAITAFSRKQPEMVTQAVLAEAIPAIMGCIRDRNIPVKLAGEKALLSVLKLHEGEGLLREYLKTIPPAEAKQLSDYHKRVLMKLVSAEQERNLNPDELLHADDDLDRIIKPPKLGN